MAQRGIKQGSKNPKINRFAAVKMRQLIADNFRAEEPLGWKRLYVYFLVNGRIPPKSDGELLGEQAFGRQFKQVAKDFNHGFDPFFIVFLYRAARAMYRAEKKCGSEGYIGSGEISRMLGLCEVTVKDILILEGEIS